MIRFIALLGVMAISFTAVLVRLADVTPLTAGFFRAAYALPILLVMWLLTRILKYIPEQGLLLNWSFLQLDCSRIIHLE